MHTEASPLKTATAECEGQQEHSMHTGTICDIDSQGGFGLIDADDGHIVCFNKMNVEAPMAAGLQVGMRVAFVADRYPGDQRITSVRLWSTCSEMN